MQGLHLGRLDIEGATHVQKDSLLGHSWVESPLPDLQCLVYPHSLKTSLQTNLIPCDTSRQKGHW